MKIEDILKSLKSRDAGTRWGIGTALQYMREVEGCFGEGLCPVKTFHLSGGELWRKELEEAAARLTFCSPEMEIKGVSSGTGIHADAVLTFEGVLTTSRKDRDRDIVEPAGLQVDESMPLLWQHIQLQPIGKLIAVTDQNDRVVRVKSAIADTELGRDAAVLVKFGALRISQGFRPSVFEPIEIIKGADGMDVVRGWHVKEAECMEHSLVSIPSNVDAVITAYSRDSLSSPLVKAWAKGYYDRRPVQAPGFTFPVNVDLQVKVNGQSVTGGGDMSELLGESPVEKRASDGQADSGDKLETCPKCEKGKLDSTGTCAECGYIKEKAAVGLDTKAGRVLSAANRTKIQAAIDALSALLEVADADKAIGTALLLKSPSEAELVTKASGVERNVEGSFEWVQGHLNNSLGRYLKQNGVGIRDYYGWAHTYATFADTAVVLVEQQEPGGERKQTCYRISWELSEDGTPQWTGDLKEVAVKPSVVEKALRERGLWPKSLEEHARELAGRLIESDDADAVLKAVDAIVPLKEALAGETAGLSELFA